ncbi:MAG: UDP-3-O-acyl-N-acetylglucosamine deacetylase [Bacteroidales bacterium]|jgi:UDP-3-O-[3-hydroxymyristoyl] N-acetylglucosamine deacetylase/3-hydroxyacyl-[acyl-carrier-protein] dehydratase|nr:UDP-3-O-acyl-N-acetylglucosamine deacetylase [Bacteroidales bacterium]
MLNQSTIGGPVSVSGKGLHSGREVHVHFKPAPENHGIVFQRVDLEDKPLIHADVSNVYDTSRGTSLMENGAKVKTVEHLMAALAGLSIDNVLVEVDAAEIPILDGSAKIFVELLTKAGVKEQSQPREYIVIENEIHFKRNGSGTELIIRPADRFKVNVKVDYGTKVLADQQMSIDDMQDFIPHIYDSRTFVFLHELQFLIQHNLAKGGDVDNAIVFVDKKPEPEVLQQLAIFFNKKNMEVMEDGVLNHNPLHHENEPARHKLLDLIGDLYLLGKPIKGEITAIRPGHFANTEFAKLIAEDMAM